MEQNEKISVTIFSIFAAVAVGVFLYMFIQRENQKNYVNAILGEEEPAQQDEYIHVEIPSMPSGSIYKTRGNTETVELSDVSWVGTEPWRWEQYLGKNVQVKLQSLGAMKGGSSYMVMTWSGIMCFTDASTAQKMHDAGSFTAKGQATWMGSSPALQNCQFVR